MKVVCNSSVLIALSAIEKLDLLPKRFPEGVLIPQAVWREVVETGNGQPGAREVASAGWLTVCETRDRDFIALLRMDLDQGEAEAIALSCEAQAGLLLLDEKDARRVAQHLGIKTLGTVGLLIWAKRSGVIANLREQLDALQIKGRFRLSQAVYDEALRAVEELMP